MLNRFSTFLQELKTPKDTYDIVFNSPEFSKIILLNEIKQNNTLLNLRVRIADIFDPEMEQIATYTQDDILSLQFCGHFQSFGVNNQTNSGNNQVLHKFVDIYGYLGLVDKEEFTRLLKSYPKEDLQENFESIWELLSENNQNKKCLVENYYPVLFYLYNPNTNTKTTIKIGDYIQLDGVFSSQTTEIESDTQSELSSFQDFDCSYRNFYNANAIPSFYGLLYKPVIDFKLSLKEFSRETIFNQTLEYMRRFESEDMLKDISGIDQLVSIVCSKIYFGLLGILHDELSALMFLFGVLSSKKHKLNEDYIDFISVNLFNISPNQRSRIIRFINDIQIKSVYVNISSETKHNISQIDSKEDPKINNSENISLENLPKQSTSPKNSFSNLKTEQFTFDNLIGKKRLFAEKCHESGVVLQGSIIPRDNSSLILIDETTLVSSKKFDPFSSKQLLGLQNALSTHSLQWDFKFGTVVTHDCLHKIIGISSSLSVMDFRYKVYVGEKVKSKSKSKELKVIKEVNENEETKIDEVKNTTSEDMSKVKCKIKFEFLDETVISLFKPEFVNIVLKFFTSFIGYVNIPDKSKEYIQNHYVVTRKEVKKGKEYFKEFSSKDLQNCIRISKHIAGCRVDEDLSESDYKEGFEIYKEIQRRINKYLGK